MLDGWVAVNCAFCEKKFVLDTQKRGRANKYCSDSCKTKASKKRTRNFGKKYQEYFLGGKQNPKEKFKEPERKIPEPPKERKKRSETTYIKRIKEYKDLPNYLDAVKKYNKIYKWIEKNDLLTHLENAEYFTDGRFEGKDASEHLLELQEENFKKLRYPNKNNIVEVIKSCERILNDIYRATNGAFGIKKRENKKVFGVF